MMAAIRISPDSERLISGIGRGIAIYTVVVGLIGALAGLSFMGGIMVGGALTYFNFIWLAAIVRGMITGESSAEGFAVKTAAKVLLIYGAVGALIGLGLVEAIPFLIGITSLVAGVIFAGFMGREGPSQEED